MPRLLRTVIVATGAIIASVTMLSACGGETSAGTPPPSGSGGNTITGRERLGWTQPAASASELATYGYALYVDGQRSVLGGVSCPGASSDGGFDCSAPLPPLGSGPHALELAAFITSGDTIIEGPRSAALQVSVASITAPRADAGQIQDGMLVSSDGLQLHASILARDLDTPVDLGAAPNGRVFVAGGNGTLRMIDPRPAGSVEESTPSADDNLLALLGETPSPATSIGSWPRLLSLALASDSGAAQAVFVAYATVDRGQQLVRIARLRVRGRTPGEAAILASFPVTASDVSAILRFGPDGHLYIGIGGSDPQGAQNLSSMDGKVLRIRDDGTTPPDSTASSPVLTSGHRAPRGLAWLVEPTALWEVEAGIERDEMNHIEPGANYGWPLIGSEASHGTAGPSLSFPSGTEPSGVTAVPLAGSPFSGELIVSTLGSRDLLRIRFDADGRPRLVGHLLQGRFGRIAQVTNDVDGALLLITANGAEWGPGRDVLVRLRPRDF
jgi:glucose/arabinose dehydrogenase